MAANLTDQVRQIAQVTTAVANGDLTQKVTVEAKGEVAALAETINSMTDTLRAVRRAGDRRRARGGHARACSAARPRCPGVAGTWKDLTDSRQLDGDQPDRPGAQHRRRSRPRSPTATCPRQITVDAQGEILELKRTINTMVDQLSSFADEVTRVAREVGTEGVLGGQAEVKGVSGTWRDLTESVNFMAVEPHRPGAQHRQVTTAVADGDLSQKITVEAKGEIAAAQGDDQHDGRPALVLRRRGHARRARGRHRGQARRPGRGRGRVAAPGAT